jgi:predicted ArsR family transcriptional regulator
MYGDKAGKQERLQRIVDELKRHPQQTQVELSRRLRVPSSTISDDLRVLEDLCKQQDHAHLVQQDGRGRLSLCDCWWLRDDGDTGVYHS